jgi:alkanesulfonate monooxygenase SsuD/methylene tetrahydromethanopterin reductase-like flavin-dependent oxidoreductase (luciferase family)
MQLGVMVEGQEGLGWDLWRRLFHAAEDLGFESLWRSDHYFSFGDDRTLDALEPFISMAVLAAETKRIRFGPLVSSVTFRHPSMHETFGLALPAAGERLDRLAEAIQVARALWADGPASFSGRHFTLTDAECYPKPAQRPLPVLVGGNGERRTLRIVAEHANEWNGIGLDVVAYRAKREVLHRHCEAVGRDPATIAHSLMLGYVIGRDDRELAERYAHLARTIPMLAGGEPDAAAGLATLRARGWLVGGPGEIVEALGRLTEAGLGRVMLHHLAMDDFAALELLASEVLPQAQDPG